VALAVRMHKGRRHCQQRRHADSWAGPLRPRQLREMAQSAATLSRLRSFHDDGSKTLYGPQKPGERFSKSARTVLRAPRSPALWAVTGRSTGPTFHFEIPPPAGRGAGQSTSQFLPAEALNTKLGNRRSSKLQRIKVRWLAQLVRAVGFITQGRVLQVISSIDFHSIDGM